VTARLGYEYMNASLRGRFYVDSSPVPIFQDEVAEE
jgi:hypothetical protein